MLNVVFRGKKSLFYGNRPKKMNVVGNSITELKSLNITIWKVFIKEFHLWCLCSPLFFVQCLICPLKLLCRIYSYMAFVLVFFLFVCFCINSYIHLGEKRVRPSSQTQLGLDSWIQKFLPFHGLFIIIFRILFCVLWELQRWDNAAGFHSGSVVLHCSHLQETRAKQKEALSPVFSSAALIVWQISTCC